MSGNGIGGIMYTVIGSFRTRTQRVLWACEEMGIAYEWSNARPQSEEVRAVSAAGKVPVLVADGTALVDSEAILSFLSDRHQMLGFEAGSIERARQDAHLAFAIENIDAPLWMRERTNRFAGSVPDVLNLSVEKILNQAFDVIAEQTKGKKYLMGDIFTIADIYTAHCLGWAKGVGLTLSKEALAYYRLCYARPAAKAMREKYA